MRAIFFYQWVNYFSFHSITYSSRQSSYSVETGRKSAEFKRCPLKLVLESRVPNCELNLARLRCYIIVEKAVCWDMASCLINSWPNCGWVSCLYIVDVCTSCPRSNVFSSTSIWELQIAQVYYYYYYYYCHHHHHHHHHRIYHFSPSAGKYSHILECNNQQD